MSAKLSLTRKARKEFSRLSLKERKKIIKKLEALQADPYLGKTLRGKLKGLCSLKAWPYRIIYEVTSLKQLTVLQIIHRQKAYR
ncbi:type II toxin-antitoxin system RelE/ParE family toxin [Candidatus Shapirobacteria bacterium]|nr:type II toxin-antitoxin system RelE/ParE family toxin [Candidatus Shapirobacteria bacterium]